MEVILRAKAKELGLKRYFTGKPCKFGHIAQRKIENGSCVECAKGLTRRWRENGSKASENFNAKGKDLPTQEYLKECFTYVDGELFWNNRPEHHFTSKWAHRVNTCRFAGKLAGHYHKSNGYLEVRLGDRLYKGHRLIYKLLTGIEPTKAIDHIDRDVSNNRIENLREATPQENARNSKAVSGSSLYKEVWYDKGFWVYSITVQDKSIVARADSEVAAARMYDSIARQTFGDFANLNFPDK